MKESYQYCYRTFTNGNTYVTCSQEEYDELAFRNKLEPGTAYLVSEITAPASDLTINSSFWDSATTIQDVISDLCRRSSVKFTCTHCGTECFEECKFTPKCPNCGSLMSRV